GLIRGRVLYDEPMSRYTSWAIGGPADGMAFPRDVEDLRTLLRLVKEEGLPCMVLGGGSNTLVKDGGIRGVVINLQDDFRWLTQDGEVVRAGAAVRVSRLLAFLSKIGLSGLECLTGVPGTVGGAVRGNAGAFGGAVADHLTKVWAVDQQGQDLFLAKDALQFSYRRFSLPEGAVIVEATFGLRQGDPPEIRRKISQNLVHRNRTQPVEFRSCGSVFKNPPGDYAGKLVEAVGLKGHRGGDAQVSEKHGNFIVNLGRATAKDVLALIHLIQEQVKAETGVALELEVRVVGED
ncbi:MAG: UDP-N-acetylmuramate dehydrogenase, partial [candidate division NC10 bacterium]|nr:UDP-N-acetylmuramate dehydrogenase [candidate division NC10 bacterium]